MLNKYISIFIFLFYNFSISITHKLPTFKPIIFSLVFKFTFHCSLTMSNLVSSVQHPSHPFWWCHCYNYLLLSLVKSLFSPLHVIDIFALSVDFIHTDLSFFSELIYSFYWQYLKGITGSSCLAVFSVCFCFLNGFILFIDAWYIWGARK